MHEHSILHFFSACPHSLQIFSSGIAAQFITHTHISGSAPLSHSRPLTAFCWCVINSISISCLTSFKQPVGVDWPNNARAYSCLSFKLGLPPPCVMSGHSHTPSPYTSHSHTLPLHQSLTSSPYTSHSHPPPTPVTHTPSPCTSHSHTLPLHQSLTHPPSTLVTHTPSPYTSHSHALPLHQSLTHPPSTLVTPSKSGAWSGH